MRMSERDKPMPAATRRGTVVPRCDISDRCRKFFGERRSVVGRSETDVGVDRQRGQALVSAPSRGGERAELAHRPSSHCDQVACRQPVGLGELGITNGMADLESLGDGPVQILGEPASGACSHDLDQANLLK